ncbi:MAG: hypothetical protein ACLQNV_17995 [Steroidobacteraceae bacterium]
MTKYEGEPHGPGVRHLLPVFRSSGGWVEDFSHFPAPVPENIGFLFARDRTGKNPTGATKKNTKQS